MTIEKKDILERTAPCGLLCGTCVSFAKGQIKGLSAHLLKRLEGFENYAGKFANFWPEMKNYPEFQTVLKAFSEVSCPGCRAGGQSDFDACKAKDCYKEMEVDFCAFCSEFPCEKNQYSPELKQKWLENSQKIKEKGIEAYYEEESKKPRYGI